MKPIIVSVAGPSGAGKSFLASLLKSEHSFQEIELTLDSLLNEKNIDKLRILFQHQLIHA